MSAIAAPKPLRRRGRPPGDTGRETRRAAVLEGTLAVMAREGDGFSMTALARALGVSKETLYRWFGDREGLIVAAVRWQAAKVALPDLPEGPLDAATLEAALENLARRWITTVTGPASIALNRLAIGAAGRRSDGHAPPTLGGIVLENGPRAIAARLAPLFARAREAGLIGLDDARAFSLLFGLVIADTQIRVLLGEAAGQTLSDPDSRARAAARAFLVLAAPAA